MQKHIGLIPGICEKHEINIVIILSCARNMRKNYGQIPGMCEKHRHQFFFALAKKMVKYLHMRKKYTKAFFAQSS